MKKKSKMSTSSSNKKALSHNKQKYFNKLSRNEISYLIKFLNFKEQIKSISLNSKFKNSFCAANDIKIDDLLNFFKYYHELDKLRNYSNIHNPYLNTFLNLNIFNLDTDSLNVVFNETINKFKILKYFIEENFYSKQSDNKFLLQINSGEDCNKYFQVLNLLPSEIRENLRYYVKMEAGKISEDEKDSYTKLFELITFKNVKPFSDKYKRKLSEIQNIFIEKQIKCLHKCFYLANKNNEEKISEYCKKYPNCLLSIRNKDSLKFCGNNSDSINSINIDGPLNEFDYKLNNLRKIKFLYGGDEEFNKVCINNFLTENIEEISAICVTRKNIDLLIEKINKINCVKKMTMMTFGGEEEEEEKNSDEIKKELFQKFFNGISKKHKLNLIELTTWSYVFKKGKDYEFIINLFPNLRKVQEFYDTSGLMDVRLEINKIFTCNAESSFQENDLVSLVKIIKNFIKQKKPWVNSIKFDLFVCMKRLIELFKYFNENNEKEILSKIDYINFCVNFLDDNDNVIALPGLEVINRVSFDDDNICLLKLLNDVKIINQVLINNGSIFKNNLNFFLNKNITSLIWNAENLDNDEAENILKIKGLEYLVINKKLIKDMKIFERIKIKIIDKKYYIDDIYRL